MNDKKYLSNDEYKNNIYELEKELDVIFNKLTDNQTINSYEAKVLYKKIINVSLEILNNSENIINNNNHNYETLKNKIKLIQKIIIINMLLCFISIFIPIFNFIYFPISQITNIICLYKIFKYKKQIDKILVNSKDPEFARYLNKITNEINNCKNFINHINKNRTISAEDESKSIEERKFDIANNIISLYIDKDISKWETVPKNIKNVVISILQHDLKTEETDIYTLINIARKNLNNINTNEQILEQLNRLRKK